MIVKEEERLRCCEIAFAQTLRALCEAKNTVQSVCIIIGRHKIPWPESASELYRPSDRHLSKLVPTFADIGCHVVSVTDPYCRIIAFLDPIIGRHSVIKFANVANQFQQVRYLKVL
jgi:hypothetical protein